MVVFSVIAPPENSLFGWFGQWIQAGNSHVQEALNALNVWCRGPASAESRDILRMDNVGEWRKIDKEIKKETWGDHASSSKAHLLYSSRGFYTLSYTYSKVKMQSQLNIPSVITFIDIRFLPAKVLFSVHHLLFQRPVDIPWPLFDKGWSARTPEQWFSLKVFLLKFLACVTLKGRSYILMEQRFSRLQQRKNLLTQSLMLLMLRLLLVLSTSWLYVLPGTQWIRDVRTWQ